MALGSNGPPLMSGGMSWGSEERLFPGGGGPTVGAAAGGGSVGTGPGGVGSGCVGIVF